MVAQYKLPVFKNILARYLAIKNVYNIDISHMAPVSVPDPDLIMDNDQS